MRYSAELSEEKKHEKKNNFGTLATNVEKYNTASTIFSSVRFETL